MLKKFGIYFGFDKQVLYYPLGKKPENFSQTSQNSLLVISNVALL
jgi:hypothetical protein